MGFKTMKLLSSDIFWQRIHKSAKINNLPLRVMFELTYKCNFKCKHCYVPYSYRKYKDIKTKEAFSIIDQLADIGCFYLGFTGGEPFARKDLMDILWYARKKGFEVIIYTNGLLIDKSKAKELAKIRLNKIDITIPAMSERPFEKITGVKGSHKKVFNAIELLRKNNVPLGFKTCVLKENEKEIGDIQRFAQSLGALHRLDDTLSPRLDGSREPYEYVGNLKNICHSEPLRSKGEESKREILRFAQDDTSTPLFKCGVGAAQAAITSQGELKPCLMIDEPRFKIHDNGLKDAWVKLKEFISSIGPDKNYKCDICNLQGYCKWCPAKSWLYNKTFTSCDPESYKKAKGGMKCQKN